MKIDLTRKDLAINGGTPFRAKDLKWLDNFTTGEEEKNAVTQVFDSGYLSLFEGSHTPDHPFSFEGGPFVQKFEQEWSDYYGVKHAISMNSATSGLYAAIGALALAMAMKLLFLPTP